MHKILQLIKNFLYNNNMPPSMKVVTCPLDELDEKPNHTKTSKSGNFKGKGCKAKDSFFNHLIKKIQWFQNV